MFAGEGKTPSDVACSDLTRDTLQLPPADPMLAKILAEFDAVAEAVVPCLPEETRKCDQLLQVRLLTHCLPRSRVLSSSLLYPLTVSLARGFYPARCST